jgi:hypothetical protein
MLSIDILPFIPEISTGSISSFVHVIAIHFAWILQPL